MHIINIALSLLLFVASFPVAAQKFNPYYYFKHLNVENGLAENVVYHFSEAQRADRCNLISLRLCVRRN
jgi:hypothetical protein